MAAIVSAVIARARERGWDDAMLERTLVASLTSRRLQYGVVGPCVYCGDELADNVDHVIPVANGGPDDLSNLVSACQRCNVAKGKLEASGVRTGVQEGEA